MSDKRVSNRKISLIISLIYVGLGTMYSLVYWSNSNPGLEGFGLFIYYFFLPVSFISIAIMFTSRDPGGGVLIVQLITFFVVWGLMHMIVSSVRERVSDKIDDEACDIQSEN